MKTLKCDLHLGVPRVPPFDFESNSPVGSRIKAVCSATEDAKLTWLKDGFRLVDKQNGILLQERGDLLAFLIDSVRPNHSGNYTCVAENSFGKSSYSATLTVAAGPEWLKIPEDKTLAIGSNVELVCQADGFPPPKIVWKLNGGTVNPAYSIQR